MAARPPPETPAAPVFPADPAAHVPEAVAGQDAAGAAAGQDAAAVLASLPSDELVDLYFEADGADERDVVFAQICALRGPATDTFLLAVLAHDEDPFLRLAAAGALLGRGYDQARGVLLDALYASGDDELFAEAMDTLVGAVGPGAFDDLLQLADDDGRDATERLLALRGLERADPSRACALHLARLAAMPATRPVDAAALEIMLGCFARENPEAGAEALGQLLARLPATADEAGQEVRAVLTAAQATLLAPVEGPA